MKNGNELSGKRKKILIIGSTLLPNPSANGVCVCNIAKEFLKEDCEVYCIGTQKKNQQNFEISEGLHIYRIKEAWFSKFHDEFSNGSAAERVFCKVVHLLRNVCLIPFHPNTNPIRSRKVYRLACKLVVEKKIDIVIGSYKPYESIYTVQHLKSRYGKRLYCISYYLDYLIENKYTSVIRDFYVKSCRRAQEKDICCLDRVLIPIAEKQQFEAQYGAHSNVDYLELPVYVKEECTPMADLPYRQDTINLAFVGSLNTWNRSPERLLKLLKAVQAKYPNMRLHVWGNTNDTKNILAQCPEFVEYHGYVESKYIPSIIDHADWVVNISNKRDFRLVPSKIFQLFASGKPILNYVFDRNDVSLPYFERYENTYWVYDDEANSEVTVTKLAEALQKKWLPLNVGELYRGNMPEVVAEKILRGFDKKE